MQSESKVHKSFDSDLHSVGQDPAFTFNTLAPAATGTQYSSDMTAITNYFKTDRFAHLWAGNQTTFIQLSWYP